ncbi:MAG: CotH kinase family protein, partial [Bacteroidia bacterium]|nr:CotH kinase family protein [Bacteroidia bacterium]
QYPPFPGADQRPLYVYHYPDGEDIVEIQAQYIKDLFDSFEDVMAGNDYEDENTGYPSIIDVETFVDFFFVNEIGRNVDGYRLSTFFYKDKDSNGGKIKAGPVWDFNLAFGNANYCEGGNTAGWAYNFSDYCPEDFFAMPFWWPKLLSSDSFQAVTKERWQELRQGPLSTETILYIYDSLATEVADAAIRNFQRWPVLDIHIWPNAQVAGSIAAELQWTRTWIIDRLTWMDNQINSFVSDVFDVEFVSDFHIYPQPTSAEISLEFVPLKSGPAIMTIYNSLGQSLESLEMQLSRNTAFSTTLRPNFPHGYFIFQIIQNGQLIKSGKIIKH